MPFNITMQLNSSEDNRVDKDITDIITLTGTLKAQTSIIDPVILIQGDISNVAGSNYMTIPIFGRSYFIRDIKAGINNLFEISAHVDVLSSFKDEIRACSGIVHRQENRWNLYLDDGSFRIYNNPMVLTRAFPGGFDAMEFVLAVAGSAQSNESGDEGGSEGGSVDLL